VKHYTHNYLIDPLHKVTIDLIGAGGTGSQVLINLARMNEALMKLGHPGLHVRCWDGDLVTAANMGRQLFSPADVGQNKAIVLVTRINRFFGFEWEAKPAFYVGKVVSNILITCIDTAKGRLDIAEKLKTNPVLKNQPTDTGYYWLDLGNLQKTGQVVLGTLQSVPQPKVKGEKCKASLPTVVKMFPQLKKIKDEQQGPSCSLAEALERQDLFINSTLAQYGCALLWKLFREGMIKYHGCYVNLESFVVNPIKVA
jgi:PRTRC genetic system ThiF family protein